MDFFAEFRQGLSQLDRDEFRVGIAIGALASLVLFVSGLMFLGWHPGHDSGLEWSRGLSTLFYGRGGFGGRHGTFTLGTILGMVVLWLLASRPLSAFLGSALILPLPLVFAIILEHGFGSSERGLEPWPALIGVAYFKSAMVHLIIYLLGHRRFGPIFTFRGRAAPKE
ncbi:MAG: hypothetical protein ACJAZ8_002122 [Planctomycetota bacterium]|jgi:hypothetical protein